MFRKQWFLQDGENGGDGGGGSGGGSGGDGGAGKVDAATARTFLTDFVHDPEAIKDMDDNAVLEYHGRVTGAIDKVRPAGGKWPDKWKDELAGGDEKARQRLERFATPGDIFKSFRALEQRVSSGELKLSTPFPEKGTDEEKAKWRADNGLPPSHDKYELKLPEGLTIGEADKPGVDEYLKYAHEQNLHPDAVNKNVAWFFKQREQGMKAAKEAEAKAIQETEDALRAEWGNDYRKHEGVLDGFLAETVDDEDLRADLAKARKLIPGFSKWMLGMALQMNPSGTVLPGVGGDQAKAIGDEIADLKRQMRDPSSDYNSKDKGPALQERYRQLLRAQEKQQQRKVA